MAYHNFYSSLACSFQGLGLAWLWVFLSLAHSLLIPWFCYHSYHATLLFLLRCYLTHSCWASFEPATCSSLNWLQWPSMVIGFILMLLWAFLTHYIACGLFWPISFSLGILGPLSNSAFPWAFTNSFGLSWSNYCILHSWSSWALHQPITFLLHAVAHSYISTSYNAHRFTTSFSRLL